MEQVSTAKFLFKSKLFNVKVTLSDFRALPDNIFLALINDPHVYNIQTNVSEDILKIFFNYFTAHELPNIQISNFISIEQLNKEFCIPSISSLIEKKEKSFESCLLYIESIKNPFLLDKADIEEKIAQNLDIYINKYGDQLLTLPIQSLFNILNRNNRRIKDHNKLYELLNNYYLKTNNISVFSLLQFVDARELSYINKLESIDQYYLHGNFVPSFSFSSISTDFHELKRCQKNYYKLIKMMKESTNLSYDIKSRMRKICGDEDIKNALDFNDKIVTLENGLSFELDDYLMTAEVVDSKKANAEIIIPHFIVFESKKYVIKRIDTSSFLYTIKSIDFPNDSEVKIFECKSICYSQIEYIKIPSSVEELKEGWCAGLNKLIKVEISSDNHHFKIIDNKYIIGKTNKDNDVFDKLIFANRDIDEIMIPSNIKRIDSYCFENCTKLKSILFHDDDNNQVESIGKNAFSSTSIENIKIPSNVTIIEEGTFYNCSQLKTIEIPSDSKLQTIGKNAFSSTSIENIKIPSNVTIIEEGTFYKCSQLKTIEIPLESRFHTIFTYTFSYSLIKCIKIPSSVTKIGKEAFYHCSELTEIEISSDSKLQTICEKAFASSSIESIKFPPSLKYIEDRAFYECKKLKIVDFTNNSEIQAFGPYIFSYTSIEQIIIPPLLDQFSIFTFQGCKNLMKVIYSSNLQYQKIGEDPFDNLNRKIIFSVIKE